MSSWPHPYCYSTLIFGVLLLHQISLSINLKLISREIIWEIFQPMWSRYLNVTDRRTDRQTDSLGQTTYCGITALCVASPGPVKVLNIIVSKMTSLYSLQCTGTVVCTNESESGSGIRKWEQMWFKTTAEDVARERAAVTCDVRSRRRPTQQNMRSICVQITLNIMSSLHEQKWSVHIL